MDLCRTPVEFPPLRALKADDNWSSPICLTKWIWKYNPRLTEMDALSKCQEAQILFLLRGKKNLFSGNCQVGCCLLYVLQLGHHTPHKICILWFQSLSVQYPCLLHCCHGVSFAMLFDWGFWATSIFFSAMLHLCRDALVGQKLRLLSFRPWTCSVSSSAHPFPLES